MRTLAAQIGFAARRGRISLSGYDFARFLSPLNDVLADISDTLGAYRLAHPIESAPGDIVNGIQLLSCLATPMVAEQVVEEQLVVEPFLGKQLVEKPFLEKQLVEKPLLDEQLVEEPLIEKQLVDEPFLEEPLVEKQLVEKP